MSDFVRRIPFPLGIVTCLAVAGVLPGSHRLNGCTYCMAAQTTLSTMEALCAGTAIADPKLEAQRIYAEKVNVKWGWVEDADIEALLAAGYTKQTIFDVIVGTAYKGLSNYSNHVAQTPLGKAFAKNEWSAGAQPVG